MKHVLLKDEIMNDSHLSCVRCFLGDLESGLKAVSKEIALDVKVLCAVD
jgi:hypothetical protein